MLFAAGPTSPWVEWPPARGGFGSTYVCTTDKYFAPLRISTKLKVAKLCFKCLIAPIVVSRSTRRISKSGRSEGRIAGETHELPNLGAHAEHRFQHTFHMNQLDCFADGRLLEFDVAIC